MNSAPVSLYLMAVVFFYLGATSYIATTNLPAVEIDMPRVSPSWRFVAFMAGFSLVLFLLSLCLPAPRLVLTRAIRASIDIWLGVLRRTVGITMGGCSQSFYRYSVCR